jgi:hypothetical protein
MNPEWITAIGEIGTAIGTIGAVIVALVVSVGEARRRRIAEDRKQASQISAWLVDYDQPRILPESGGPLVRLKLRNVSDELVYNLVATVVSAQAGTPYQQLRTFVGRLAPGESEYAVERPEAGMHRRFSVELAFEDSGGRFWRRGGKGRLERVTKDPLALYEIDPPVSWLMP